MQARSGTAGHRVWLQVLQHVVRCSHACVEQVCGQRIHIPAYVLHSGLALSYDLTVP